MEMFKDVDVTLPKNYTWYVMTFVNAYRLKQYWRYDIQALEYESTHSRLAIKKSRETALFLYFSAESTELNDLAKPSAQLFITDHCYNHYWNNNN